ncbi:MAG: hypothetical protein GXP46_00525 [Deferribacteres bacterium]|nr:hypothetical protein [Deferribacteres bacterium]
MSGDRLFTEQELKEMTRHEYDQLYEILKDDEQCTQVLKTYESLNQAVLDIYLNFLGTVLGYVQEKKGLEGFREAALRFGNVMWKGWFSQVHNTGRWMQSWKEEPYRSHYKKAIMDFAAFMRAQAGRGMKLVEEDDKKVTFTVDPCGSGGMFRRAGKYRPPFNWPVTREPHPLTFGRADFPYYCQHCALFHYQMPIEWAGTIWPVMRPGERDEDPCIMEFYKDPRDIPEEYFTMVGKQKPVNERS